MKNHEFINDTLIVFEGFYESYLFNSDTEFYLNELLQDSEHPETYEITGQNYKDYEKSVCELHADSLNECLNDLRTYEKIDIVKSVKFKNMTSPAYYNFTTDKLHLLVDFNLTALKKYCFIDNREDFNFYLQENYTSYDGFISFIDNNIKDFEKIVLKRKLDSWESNKKDAYIDIMLEYHFIRAIFDNKTAEKIYNDNLHDTDTDYKQRIYEQLTELQIEYSTVIEDNKQAV